MIVRIPFKHLPNLLSTGAVVRVPAQRGGAPADEITILEGIPRGAEVTLDPDDQIPGLLALRVRCAGEAAFDPTPVDLLTQSKGRDAG